MTQLCENDAIASSSAAAVAEVAAQVGGVNIRLVDDMYFLRHILDMKPSSDDDSSSNIEIHTSSPNSPPTPQRTRSRLLGHRQSMTASTTPYTSSSISTSTSSQNHQQNNHHQTSSTSPYSSPPISTSPNGYTLYHPGMKD
uniref:Uncharacterized protein n=1 Tax=Panagrolaimus sp. ES5 TaxID=591445 RepID=A0AC34GDZ1_9BILA